MVNYMSNRKDELERKKFIEENPDTLEIFDEVIDLVFGKSDDDKDKNKINE